MFFYGNQFWSKSRMLPLSLRDIPLAPQIYSKGPGDKMPPSSREVARRAGGSIVIPFALAIITLIILIIRKRGKWTSCETPIS